MDNKNIKQLLMWGLGFMLLVTLFNGVKGVPLENEIPYSEFKARLRAGSIIQVRVRPDLVSGEYKDEKNAVQRFRTLPLPDPKLVEELEAKAKAVGSKTQRNPSIRFLLSVQLTAWQT